MRLFAAMHFAGQLFIGRRIGDLMYLLTPRRRQITRINIELCFPELDARERHKLLRLSFQSAGISVTESAFSWWGSEARLRRLYRLEGIEHLNDALRQGKGVLLLGGHYTTLEIGGHLLALHTHGTIQPIYKPARNSLFNAVMVHSRSKIFDDLLLNRDMRTIIHSLKANNVVWYAPDQDFGPAQALFAPFMGIAAASLTMTSRLAKISGAPVLPFYSHRLPHTPGYLIKFLPPLQDFTSIDDLTDSTLVNHLIHQHFPPPP